MINLAKKHLIPQPVYLNEDVVELSKLLLGKYLYTYTNRAGVGSKKVWTGGIIVETEAYCGATDQACHAYPNVRTKRTETMYQGGGIAYVYLCYGIHSLFNVVSNQQGKADAILIRAIEPTTGIETMLERRNMKKTARRLTGGPGCLAQALGIGLEMNALSLSGPTIWMTDACIESEKLAETVLSEKRIDSTRVGVESAGDSALLNWRFRIKDNKWTSPAK